MWYFSIKSNDFQTNKLGNIFKFGFSIKDPKTYKYGATWKYLSRFLMLEVILKPGYGNLSALHI